MAENTVSNSRLYPSENEGFIVEYDLYGKGDAKSEYSSRSYIGCKKEVFVKGQGQEALKRLMALNEMEPDAGTGATPAVTEKSK